MRKQQVPMQVWRRRMPLVLLALMALAVLLVLRAIELQVLQKDFLLGQGQQRQHRSVSIPAHRGMILDRMGKPLAISTPVDSVWVEPEVFATARKDWQQLLALLQLKKASIDRRLAEAGDDREFMYLKRHISPELGQQVLDLQIAGVNLQREYRRYYPGGEVSGHMIGFTNIDDKGQEGVELAFNEWLTGTPGRKRIIQDRLGRAIKEVNIQRSAAPGKDLTLSLDERLQYLAYRELKSAVFNHAARAGSMVVLDVNSGEVLAMANQPAFNPNDRKRSNTAAYRNRAVTDLFEPGSTMKPFTLAAAMMHTGVKANAVVDTSPGYIEIGQYKVTDPRNLGRLSLAQIISHSSNVGASLLALSMPAETMWQVYHQAGFGQTTGVSFPGEVSGQLAAAKQWGRIEQATMSYGYGLSVSALQLARAYAAIAADGVLPVVTLQKNTAVVQGQRIMPVATARALRTMLEGVVAGAGTGRRAAIEGYRVAGKTGTSKKSALGGYTEDRYVSVFVGMVPASKPRLVGVVVIDDPRGDDYYGGVIAAPVFSKVMGGALRLLDVAPDAASYLRAAAVDRMQDPT